MSGYPGGGPTLAARRPGARYPATRGGDPGRRPGYPPRWLTLADLRPATYPVHTVESRAQTHLEAGGIFSYLGRDAANQQQPNHRRMSSTPPPAEDIFDVD